MRLLVLVAVLALVGCDNPEYRRLEAGYKLELLSCWKANKGNESMCTEKYNNQIKKLEERLG